MGKPTGFLEFTRELPKKVDPKERVKGYKEFIEVLLTSSKNVGAGIATVGLAGAGIGVGVNRVI